MQEVCLLSQLSEGKGKRFIIDDVEIAIFLVNGKVYALSNICPHKHSPIIFDGFIEDNCVICPAHGWKFNLTDGKKDSKFNGLRSFQVKIINNKVFIDIDSDAFHW